MVLIFSLSCSLLHASLSPLFLDSPHILLLEVLQVPEQQRCCTQPLCFNGTPTYVSQSVDSAT